MAGDGARVGMLRQKVLNVLGDRGETQLVLPGPLHDVDQGISPRGGFQDGPALVHHQAPGARSTHREAPDHLGADESRHRLESGGEVLQVEGGHRGLVLQKIVLTVRQEETGRPDGEGREKLGKLRSAETAGFIGHQVGVEIPHTTLPQHAAVALKVAELPGVVARETPVNDGLAAGVDLALQHHRHQGTQASRMSRQVRRIPGVADDEGIEPMTG